jgi:hypothetical protein
MKAYSVIGTPAGDAFQPCTYFASSGEITIPVSYKNNIT